MYGCHRNTTRSILQIDDVEIKQVKDLKYIRTVLPKDEVSNTKIRGRIGIANDTFQKLR